MRNLCCLSRHFVINFDREDLISWSKLNVAAQISASFSSCYGQ